MLQKGKGKKNKEDASSWGSGERQEGLHALRQLLDLNLALLWDPPVVHETFVEQVLDISAPPHETCVEHNGKITVRLIILSVSFSIGVCGRVVKAFDSKSNGLCPRRFESCQTRLFCNVDDKLRCIRTNVHLFISDHCLLPDFLISA